MSVVKSICLATVCAGVSMPVFAAGLRDHAGVNNGLVTAGITEEIYETCPSISVRKIRGLLYLRSLYNMALDAGYTEEEIDAYVDNEEEEARLRVLANRYLASKGAIEGDPETYCAVGRAEIAAGSRIGSFLREN